MYKSCLKYTPFLSKNQYFSMIFRQHLYDFKDKKILFISCTLEVASGLKFGEM